MFQLRKKRWLSCGRAVCVLGLLTVLFYTLTISKFSDKDHVDQRLMPHQYSIVNQVLTRKVNKRSAYDRQNAIIEDKRLKSRKKNNRKSIYSHRHSNGRDFYFEGYKCVPVLNPQSYLEMTRNTQRTGCNCHISGSEDRVCDSITGQCKCRPHVIGRTCDRCDRAYWNLDSKKGCSACACNINGSEHQNCESHSGQCHCKPGVEGVSCDRCRAGYFGFSPTGCKQCSICDSSAKICDQETGRCVCPPLSHGTECQLCYPNTWGLELFKGCKNCDCNQNGSLKQSCDVKTGQCVCKEGFTGRACDYCAFGYFGYPNCQKCNCDVSGSKNLHGQEIIDCDDRGQCPCKELTTGLKCDECRQSTFGLSQFNSYGCTRCFCFGRSQDCVQNPLIWGKIRMMGSRDVTVNYITHYEDTREDIERVIVSEIRNNLLHREFGEIKLYNDLTVFPSYSGNVTIATQRVFYDPFYFQLPKEFLGDRINSYGGFLNFTIITEGGRRSLSEETLLNSPLVQLHTHYQLILNYYQPQTINSSLSKQTFNVVLHESQWRYHSNGYNITRAIMMTALQNIKHIFLRATTSADFTQVVLANVTMLNGMPINGNNNAAIASGVEKCDCPEIFTGDSCQDPADGYYRWRNTTVKTSLLEDLVGKVVPCECNGRSSNCDKETGECINCRDNTGGKYCDTCAEGYYGHPDDSCQPCPCPETNKNFARGCYVDRKSVACYCKEGYTGPLCDRCSKGFFGTPQNRDGHCESCDCNIEGIVSDECDEQTGQCNCKQGVIGRRCDRCELPRHLLRDSECQLCDNCTQTLLDTVDEIMFKFETEAMDISLHDLHAPWHKLHKLSNETEDLDSRFDDYFDAVDAVDNFNDIDADNLLNKAESIHNRASRLSANSDKQVQKADKMLVDADSILMDIRDITGIVQETIINLSNYGSNDHHIKLPTALREANAFLKDLQVRSKNIPEAQKTMKCANDQLEFWSDELNNANHQKEKLENYLELRKDFNEKLDDLKNLTHRTFRDSSETEAFVTKNRKGFEKLKLKAIDIDNENDEIKALLNFGIIAQSDSLMESLHDSIAKLKIENKELVELNTMVEETITSREDEFADISETLIPKARAHAEDLSRRSKVIVGLFQHSKDGAKVAMLAGTAHKNITDAINAAREASELAYDAAMFSNDKLNPIDPEEETMIEKGQDLSLESEAIQSDAENQISKIKDLKEMLDYQQSVVNNMSSLIRTSGKTNNEMSALITKLSNSETRKIVQESAVDADRILEDMNIIEKDTNEINSNVNRLKSKLEELDPEWDSKYGLAEENVAKSLINIREANNTWHVNEPILRQQNEKFQAWNESFSLKLQELRDKIAQAKHAAEGIRVSVESSGDDCVRSYFPTSIGPSTSNSIMMTIALSSKKTDSPLLFLQGEDQKFIALEMINRKIYLIWNLGADTGIIMHPMEIQTRDTKYDDAWYKIEVSRTLNIGSLTVQRMSNDGDFINSNSVSGATSQEFTRLTIDHTSRVYMGGVPENLRPTELKSKNGLSVTVHQLFIDHLQVGLWHFSSSEGTCTGAMIGATETSDSSRHFSGQGYSVVRSVSSRPSPKKYFSLQITFKTLDENALLFLTVDEKNNRSISLTLHEGKLVFRIDYGGESQLEINTTNRYNTGKWVNVEAAREFTPKRNTENGSLKVNNEVPQTGSPTKPITSALLPDVSKALFYLGGVPPGFKSGTTKAPGADNAFFGCLKDVQINGEIFDPLDSQSYFGVEPTCKEFITKAGFNGNGYVELSSHSLRKRANFGFVFRTLQSECLLLFSGYPPQTIADYDAKDVRGNFSVSLIDGHIHVWVDAGKGRVELESNLTLNDGEFHVINVNKIGRKFELRINDDLQTVKTLSATPALVNSPEDFGGLFLGGVPEFPEFDELAPTFIGLKGAIKDVVFNNRTISFDQVMSFQHVHMGGLGPNMGVAGPMLMKTEPIGQKFKENTEGCQRVGSYSYEPNAFKFGNGPFSFSMVQIPSRKLWERNFNINFDFRTFYPDGFLFASPDSRNKPIKHYAYLFLRNGNIVFVVRGRKREEITLPVRVNDGLWHHVSIDCRNHVATLSISRNGKNSNNPVSQAKIKIPKKFFVSNIFFIGGLPQKPSRFHKEVLTKKEDLKGCIRRFSVNTITQDLAKRYNNLGQCFPRVEKGSYFSGDAYAEYKKEFDVGKNLEIELEFKTSELNGILLSIAEPPFGSPALSIEVFNGRLIMSCDLGNGEPIRAEPELASKFSLCDNKWHNISALYVTNQIAIRIDNQLFSHASSRSLGKLQTNSSLYIGGLPESTQSKTILTRENFKGCIRNVKLNSGSNGMEIVDWTDMDQLHNVLLNECPAGA